MKKIIALTFCSLLITLAYAQKKTNFELGTRWRITPIPLSPDPTFVTSKVPVLIESDSHLSGLAIVAGLTHQISKKMTVGFRLNLRYDELYAELESASSNRNNKFVNRLMSDNSFYILHNVYKKNETTFKMGFGFSFNNNNTNYSYNYIQTDNLGNLYTLNSNSDFKYETMDFPLVWDSKNITFSIIPQITLGTKFFTSPNVDFLLLNFSLVHKFSLNKK